MHKYKAQSHEDISSLPSGDLRKWNRKDHKLVQYRQELMEAQDATQFDDWILRQNFCWYICRSLWPLKNVSWLLRSLEAGWYHRRCTFFAWAIKTDFPCKNTTYIWQLYCFCIIMYDYSKLLNFLRRRWWLSPESWLEFSLPDEHQFLDQWPNVYLSSLQVAGTVATFPSSGAIVPEPLGVALVISTWNFPFGEA